MNRLLLSDLRHHAGSWTWTCVVAIVAGASVAGQLQVMHGSLASAARATGTTGDGIAVSVDMSNAAHVVAGFVVAGTVLATVTVLTSTASLAVAQRSRDHGLWRALGMQPGTLRRLVLGQLAVIGAVGSLGGSVLGRPVAYLMIPLIIDQQVAVAGTTPRWEPLDLIVCASVVAGSVVLGGRGAAHRAASATETTLMRGRDSASEGGAQRVLGTAGRLALAAGCVSGAVRAAQVIHLSGVMSKDAVNASFLGSFSAFALVCVLAPWLVPVAERVLGALPVPGPCWLVAARTAALESQRSSATVLPFVVATGLVSVMFSGKEAGFGNMRTSGFLSMFGLAFLTAWVGGVSVIAMSASRRRRDAALLRANGAQEGEVIAFQVIEGALHAVCAVALGLVVSVSTSVFLAAAAGRSTWDILVHGPWAEMGTVGALTLATTCLAVVLSARVSGRQSLGQVLRARE